MKLMGYHCCKLLSTWSLCSHSDIETVYPFPSWGLCSIVTDNCYVDDGQSSDWEEEIWKLDSF